MKMEYKKETFRRNTQGNSSGGTASRFPKVTAVQSLYFLDKKKEFNNSFVKKCSINLYPPFGAKNYTRKEK